MPRSGTLTDSERASIKIDNFIFHVIVKGKSLPTYLSKVDLEDSQREFFCERIAECAEGTQYVFQDKATGTAALCTTILKGGPNFIPSSKEIAKSFHHLHIGNVTNGAFVVAHFHIVTTSESLPLVALIKLDHKKVIQYDLSEINGENVAKMKEVLSSFVESKSAVQKCAIVEPSKYFRWDVLAQDNSTGKPITDYFRSFLDVVELENPTFWTEKAVKTVNAWAGAQSDLPEHKRNYRARAVQYMETHNTFDTDSFLDMVVLDEDDSRKKNHIAALRTELRTAGVAGQTFDVVPSVVKKYNRNRWETQEGVTIQWSGSDKAANIDVSPAAADGTITITIKTQRVDDKSKL